MKPYFSSKVRILDISKNILFLLDILAIIRFLFHQCRPSIKRAIILINFFRSFDCQTCNSTQVVVKFHRHNGFIHLDFV